MLIFLDLKTLHFRIAFKSLNTTDPDKILEYLLASNVSNIDEMSCKVDIIAPLNSICPLIKVVQNQQGQQTVFNSSSDCVHSGQQIVCYRRCGSNYPHYPYCALHLESGNVCLISWSLVGKKWWSDEVYDYCSQLVQTSNRVLGCFSMDWFSPFLNVKSKLHLFPLVLDRSTLVFDFFQSVMVRSLKTRWGRPRW